MVKYFDFIVILSFTIMLGLSLSMWVNYDKLHKRLDDQTKVVAEFMYKNQALEDLNQAILAEKYAVEVDLNRCKMFMRGN